METPAKVAVVTGAGSGIGRACALGLLAAGHRVVLAGRRAEPLHAAVAESTAPADRCLVVPTDVTDPAAVRTLFDHTVATFGRIDVLFNNAGISTPGVPPDELSFEQWKLVVDTNLTGAFLCAQAAFRVMKTQAPRGTWAEMEPLLMMRPHSVAYTATKHAITGITKSLSLDGRAFDIACSQIDIGNADTAMATTIKRGILQANGSLAAEPMIDLRHVVDAVLYLAALPTSVNVPTMTVMANQMPYIGRG